MFSSSTHLASELSISVPVERDLQTHRQCSRHSFQAFCCSIFPSYEIGSITVKGKNQIRQELSVPVLLTFSLKIIIILFLLIPAIRDLLGALGRVVVQ